MADFSASPGRAHAQIPAGPALEALEAYKRRDGSKGQYHTHFAALVHPPSRPNSFDSKRPLVQLKSHRSLSRRW